MTKPVMLLFAWLERLFIGENFLCHVMVTAVKA